MYGNGGRADRQRRSQHGEQSRPCRTSAWSTCWQVMLLDTTASFRSAHAKARMKDPRRAAAARKVEVVADPRIDARRPKREAIVEVTLADGTPMNEWVRDVRGTAENPMTREEVVAKARDLISPVLGATRVRGADRESAGHRKRKDVRELRPRFDEDEGAASSHRQARARAQMNSGKLQTRSERMKGTQRFSGFVHDLDSKSAGPDERAAEQIQSIPFAECGGLFRPHGGGHQRARLFVPGEHQRTIEVIDLRAGKSDPHDHRVRRRSSPNDLSP